MLGNIKFYNFSLVIIPLILGLIGVAAQYSISGGSWDPWAIKHVTRLGACWLLMMVIGLVPLKRLQDITFPIYVGGLAILLLVPIIGAIGSGAQRWLVIANQSFQPSELMKFAMFLAMAKFMASREEEQFHSVWPIMPALLLALLPCALVFLQPDLGTSVLMLMATGMVFFISGLRFWVFVVSGISALAAMPILWLNLHTYQKNRILSFLDPESDPLGSGYHILQSEIAFGSGRLVGRGFLEGPQTQLNFLPEAHTDFVLTAIGEEFGLIGTLGISSLWLFMIFSIWRTGLDCRDQFARLVSFGFATLFFLYFFINNAMVVGLLPVVGVPMPFVSYGGSSMFASFLALGVLQSVSVWCYHGERYG